MLKFAIAALALTVGITAQGAVGLQFDGRDAATVGVIVVDLRSGEVVESENANVAMIPASIQKSLTCASSLTALGPDFRYETIVDYDGIVDGSTLKGNLIITGAADPTIESEFFPKEGRFIPEIVEALKALGVNRITGQIVVDDGDFSDPGQNPQWALDDVGYNYGAGLYGFNYSDNVFKLYTATLRTVPEMPFVDVMTEVSKSNDVIHGINSDNYIVMGPNVEKSNNFVVTPMNYPADAFIINLAKSLAAAGITVEDGGDGMVASVSSRTRLLTHRSATNVEILRSLMFRSDNMMAEATLRSIAPERSRSAAIKCEIALWGDRGVSMRYAKIFDGSGLARSNRLTPKLLADIYAFMAKSQRRTDYVSIFPRVGKEGTVKGLLSKTRLAGQLALKSGSINGVQCFAGYKLDTAGEPTHAVVLMVNNFFCSRDSLRTAIERYLLEVF